MYIIFPINEFNKNYIELLDKKPNNIMDGFFTKLNYHSPFLSFTSLYIEFSVPIQHIEKNMIFFRTADQPCIQQFIELEKSILDLYSEKHHSVVCSSTESEPNFTYAYASSLRRKIITGSMPFNNSPFQLKEGIVPKMIIKISGIWELNRNIGIVYKLFVVHKVD
jgi:hypothetical protein